jgi:L-alanine-DL-glutamate epimerase-like enolase superfamily enzyme
LLGGSDKPVPVYWSTGEVCNPKHHANIVNQAQKEGYKSVKLRVHAKTLDEDIKVIKEIRDLVGKEYSIGIDANQGWPVTIVDQIPNWDIDRAGKFIEGIQDMNIDWLEEPLYKNSYEDLASLREKSPIKIAGCEVNSGWHEARMMLHFKSLDVYQPDVTFFGIQDALKVLEVTKKEKLGFSPHTWTNGIGLLTNMHIYSLTNREFPLEFPYEPGSWTPEFRDGILQSPIIPKDGYLELPHEPGLGVQLDWDKVKKFGTKFFEMSEGGLKRKVIKEKGLFTALRLKRRKDKELKK